MHDFDVVVIGGGCAGLWAAVAAARAGARTLLVDRNTRLGERIVCAEGVAADGIGRFIEPSTDWIATRIHGVRFVGPGGAVVEIDEPDCGFVAHKDALLRRLGLMAASHGAETWLCAEGLDVRPRENGVEVDVSTPRATRRVTCGAVVAADGIESRIGRQMGMTEALKPDEVFSCAQYTVAPVDVNPEVVEFHFGRDFAPGGYAWVFPKGQCSANVGVGMMGSAPCGSSPTDHLNRFKARRCPDSKVLGFVVGGVPSVKKPQTASRFGVFLAGDAARVADPMTGAGIVPGMESGETAGRFAWMWASGREPREVTSEFRAHRKAVFSDRPLRLALKRVLTTMTDRELARMVHLIGEYVSRGERIRSDPVGLVKFFIKSMPTTFRLAGEIVRGSIQ